MTESKPLHWSVEDGVEYSVIRRPDGGMTVTFTGLSEATIKHWQHFALEHLLDSDRLTRNLYDLRLLQEIPKKAIQAAIEVNNDPAARNIRLAVVVNNETLRKAVREIYYSVMPETSAAIKVFSDMETAEAWLSRPLDQLA